jgi:hypothetical protein
MIKIVALLVVVLLATSCQSIPKSMSEDSKIEVIPTIERVKEDSFAEVYFVLSVSNSEFSDYQDVEVEILPYKKALIKAKIHLEVKMLSHEIYKENPEPLDDQEFLLWRSKTDNLIESATKTLKKELNDINGVKEKFQVHRDESWWMDYGVVFFTQYAREIDVKDGSMIKVGSRYVPIEVEND